MEEEKLLNNRNIRPTASRILVLRYFLEKENAVALKHLEEELYWSDKSTLYRTLKTFEKNGIIHAIDDGTGMMKYALCLEDCECAPKDQHYHFHCIRCEETFCLNKQQVPSIKLPPGFQILSSNVVVKGVCLNCN